MRRAVTALALTLPLAACGVSKEVYLQKEAELGTCRTDLASGEQALADCRAQAEARAKELDQRRRGEEACFNELDAVREKAREEARKLEARLAAKTDAPGAAASGGEADAARKKAEAEAAACAEAKGKAEADLTRTRTDLEGCRGQTEAAKKEIEALKAREAELRARLDKELQEKTVEIENLKARLAVRVVDRILFDSGRAEILKAGKDVLDKVASVVAGTNERIRVEGHTDDVPISRRLKPKFFSNWELSAARAANVVRYFEYGKGIDPARMEAVGLASHRPDAPNDSFEGRAQNRRVVIVLTAPAAAP